MPTRGLTYGGNLRTPPTGLTTVKRGTAHADPVRARESEWERSGEAAAYKEGGAQLKSELDIVYDREMARAQAQLGFAASSGAGTGGQWDASRLALGRAGMARQMDITNLWKKYETEGRLAFLNREDMQAFQAQMQTERLAMMQKLAEMNQESWWSGLASIVGGGLGFLAGGPGGAAVGSMLGGAGGQTFSGWGSNVSLGGG